MWNNNENLFRLAEKKFKKMTNWNDFKENVIDFENKETLEKNNIKIKELHIDNKLLKIYIFDKPEGFILIKNYLSKESQIKIGKNCINNYFKKPNRTNLTLYEKDENFNKNLEKFLVKDKYTFNKKIRWANLGYQFDWDKREYFKNDSEIPKEISDITKDLINKLEIKNYNPETVLVNYYGEKDNMGGHIDDGEPDQIHPIISYSLGLSCIFLVGGESKYIEPLAIKLDSGDVCIMGEKSRVCFHGVPKIIKNSFEINNFYNIIKEENDIKEENNEENLLNYFSENRINITLRQVIYK